MMTLACVLNLQYGYVRLLLVPDYKTFLRNMQSFFSLQQEFRLIEVPFPVEKGVGCTYLQERWQMLPRELPTYFVIASNQ